ncbi:MAG: anti-sigma factor family protein [Fimbriimonadaceae bacterium]
MALLLVLQPRNGLDRELVADHVRSLQAGHLFDVRSTSEHTVKPWFQGRIDLSPTVPDLTAQGFILLGGRLDYLGGSPAAALVYSRGKHMINVLVTRRLSNSFRGMHDVNGYHVLGWNLNGLDYWAVTDVAAPDLLTFRADFVAAAGGRD